MQCLPQAAHVAKVMQVAAGQRILCRRGSPAAQQQLLEGPHAHYLHVRQGRGGAGSVMQPVMASPFAQSWLESDPIPDKLQVQMLQPAVAAGVLEAPPPCLTTPSTTANSYSTTPGRPAKHSLNGFAHASSMGCAPALNARHTKAAAAGCRAVPAWLALPCGCAPAAWVPPAASTLLRLLLPPASIVGGNSLLLPSECTTFNRGKAGACTGGQRPQWVGCHSARKPTPAQASLAIHSRAYVICSYELLWRYKHLSFLVPEIPKIIKVAALHLLLQCCPALFALLLAKDLRQQGQEAQQTYCEAARRKVLYIIL